MTTPGDSCEELRQRRDRRYRYLGTRQQQPRGAGSARTHPELGKRRRLGWTLVGYVVALAMACRSVP